MNVQGKTASSISITFARPMAPASVEDIHNYAISTTRPEREYDYFGLTQFTAHLSVPIPLKAAHYDPNTNTVTLIPRKPLKISVPYFLQNATPVAKQTLTDPQGNALQFEGGRAGTFFVGLTKSPLAPTWVPPEPLTIFAGK